MVRLIKFLRYSIRRDNTYWVDYFRRQLPFTHREQTKLYHLGEYLSHPDTSSNRKGCEEIYLFSVSRNELEQGNYRYNGGIKLLFNWIRVLNEHGYDARFVTHGGDYDSWTDYEPPMLSILDAESLKKEGKSLVFVTSWLLADEFLALADEVYFYDCELAYTAGSYYSALVSGNHYGKLKNLLKKKFLKKVATHSRTQQAWYMTKFGFRPDLIPIWIDGDPAHIEPEPLQPKSDTLRIGYMLESSAVEAWVNKLSTLLTQAQVTHEFVRIEGNESQCADKLRKCQVYLGFNEGKSPIFGEGSPLPQLEAMLHGNTVIAFDVNGNREYLIDYFNGFVVPVGDLDAMAGCISKLYQDERVLERMRKNAISIAENAANEELKWNRLKRFLDIE